jgi:hypothetical protein
VIKSILHPLCPSALVKFSGCLEKAVVGWMAWGKRNEYYMILKCNLVMGDELRNHKYWF